MRTTGLLALALLFASAAHTGTLNLRWDACFGDGGVVNRTFACNTNVGAEQLVATFTPPTSVDSVTSIAAAIRFVFQGAAVPAWWQFGLTGSCRLNSLSTAANLPAGASSCIDFASRDALYIYEYPSFGGPNTALLEVYTPYIPRGTFDLAAGQEYLAFVAAINHQNTIGTGSCGGCTVGTCMAFAQMVFSRPSKPDLDLFPSSAVDQAATWQGGSTCRFITSDRRSTWGDVKALYR